MAGPNCPRCGHVISSDDPLAFNDNLVFHLNCQRPRDRSPEERALIFRYCFDHAVAKCIACAASFTQRDLGADLLGAQAHLCPRCRADLAASMRTHLYTCTLIPHEARQGAKAARDAARWLIKQSGGLHERAAVLMREAEAAAAALRQTMAKAAATESRQTKDRD
jgi:hypothetical protein